MILYYTACLLVFAITYLINTTMISVFYHRGLAHSAVNLGPRMRAFVATWGIWLTGLDPKGWVCMHRLHHTHSDQELDPHSPTHYGFFGVLFAQLKSYERVLVGLARGEEEYTEVVKDIDFDINKLNRKKMWFLPYVVHFAGAIGLALTTGFWTLGACYFAGMMSHPIEGWLVNTLGHSRGYRNFETNDDSTNNIFAALLIVGEGYQNNHHTYPASAKFSTRAFEVDFGYGLCLALETVGALTINQETLIPSYDQISQSIKEQNTEAFSIETASEPEKVGV